MPFRGNQDLAYANAAATMPGPVTVVATATQAGDLAITGLKPAQPYYICASVDVYLACRGGSAAVSAGDMLIPAKVPVWPLVLLPDADVAAANLGGAQPSPHCYFSAAGSLFLTPLFPSSATPARVQAVGVAEGTASPSDAAVRS
jgi:hypothetical protein